MPLIDWGLIGGLIPRVHQPLDSPRVLTYWPAPNGELSLSANAAPPAGKATASPCGATPMVAPGAAEPPMESGSITAPFLSSGETISYALQSGRRFAAPARSGSLGHPWAFAVAGATRSIAAARQRQIRVELKTAP